MGEPSLLKTLGTGLQNLGGHIVDTVSLVDKKAITAFKIVKDKLLSQQEEKEEAEEDSDVSQLETEAVELITAIENNHKFNRDAASLSEVPFDKKPMIRGRAIATIETIGVLKRLLGNKAAKRLIDKGPVPFDDVEATAMEALLKTKP